MCGLRAARSVAAMHQIHAHIRRLATRSLLPALAAALALAAPAFAADRYVDAQTGSDANAGCTLASPCATIAAGIAAAAPGERVLVDSGTYVENVTLGEGRSLVGFDFVAADGSASPVIDGANATAITVPASGAGRIEGLVIRANAERQVNLAGTAEVIGNTFDDPDATGIVSGIGSSAVDVLVEGNTFVDPSPDETRGRIGVYASGSITVRDNEFEGLVVGVQVSGPAAGQRTLVERNEFTGIHNYPVQGRAIIAVGSLQGGELLVRENRISAASTPFVLGISAGTAAHLERNRVTGVCTGVQVESDSPGVTMEGDVIWDTAGDGVLVLDNTTGPRSSLRATGLTVWANGGVSIRVREGEAEVDSTIVEDASPVGGGTCVITNSRASQVAEDHPSGCRAFQTTADPMFEDAAAGDFHLKPGSPMIDAGDPDPPAEGAVDIDGDARAVDGTPDCETVVRRDIGADEFVPAEEADCTAPATRFTKTPPKKSKRKRVVFRFAADEPATFECKLDAGPRRPCASPARFRVKPGRHVLRVWATDAAGNVQAKPAKFAFRRARR
mgnify:FL=1